MEFSFKEEPLPDPLRGVNNSDVFIRFWPHTGIDSVGRALKRLSAFPEPLPLVPLVHTDNQTVVVWASPEPPVSLACNVSAGGREEIIRILGTLGDRSKGYCLSCTRWLSRSGSIGNSPLRNDAFNERHGFPLVATMS